MNREFLKNAAREDVHDFSREYGHDYIEDEDIKVESVKIGQKRNFSKVSNCGTVVCVFCTIKVNPFWIGHSYFF